MPFFTQCCKSLALWTDNYCGRCGRALKPSKSKGA